jgi:hypothetical protein
MRGWRFALLTAFALQGGCASVTRDRSDAAAVEAALRSAAQQVTRCYRSPRVSSEGRQIITRLRIRLTADGRIAELPAVVVQENVTPTSQPYAERMAAAAIEAVMRCTPLQLPPTFYANGRADFELTFSPLARG